MKKGRGLTDSGAGVYGAVRTIFFGLVPLVFWYIEADIRGQCEIAEHWCPPNPRRTESQLVSEILSALLIDDRRPQVFSKGTFFHTTSSTAYNGSQSLFHLKACQGKHGRSSC